MTNLIANILKIQPGLPGWCQIEKAITLASIVVGYRPVISVEIGIYGGSSFIPIAMAHQTIGTGRAIGIEAWSKETAIQAQTEEQSREWWSKIDFEKLEADFRATLTKLELDSRVTIIKQKSRNVAPPSPIGLLHIDGAHSDEAIEDVSRFARHVEIGGFCVMDDLYWTGGGVLKAENRLLDLGFTKLYALGTGAVYQKRR